MAVNPRSARACWLIAPMLATLAAPVAQANDVTFSPVFASNSYRWAVSVDGGDVQQNPELTLIRGQTYTLEVSGLPPNHSFYIKTISGIGAANAYAGGGLSANGFSDNETITFTVPQDAPDTLFYDCGVHASMVGTITIDGIFANGFEP